MQKTVEILLIVSITLRIIACAPIVHEKRSVWLRFSSNPFFLGHFQGRPNAWYTTPTDASSEYVNGGQDEDHWNVNDEEESDESDYVTTGDENGDNHYSFNDLPHYNLKNEFKTVTTKPEETYAFKSLPHYNQQHDFNKLLFVSPEITTKKAVLFVSPLKTANFTVLPNVETTTSFSNETADVGFKQLPHFDQNSSFIGNSSKAGVFKEIPPLAYPIIYLLNKNDSQNGDGISLTNREIFERAFASLPHFETKHFGDKKVTVNAIKELPPLHFPVEIKRKHAVDETTSVFASLPHFETKQFSEKKATANAGFKELPPLHFPVKIDMKHAVNETAPAFAALPHFESSSNFTKKRPVKVIRRKHKQDGNAGGNIEHNLQFLAPNQIQLLQKDDGIVKEEDLQAFFESGFGQKIGNFFAETPLDQAATDGVLNRKISDSYGKSFVNK